jgi:hypothetical protein
MKKLMVLIFSLGVFACSSKPIVPSADSVKVSREDAKPTCKEVGKVKGTVLSMKPNIEKAIEDMKTEAANKGANFVRMETASSYGTAVQGTAYLCP